MPGRLGALLRTWLLVLALVITPGVLGKHGRGHSKTKRKGGGHVKHGGDENLAEELMIPGAYSRISDLVGQFVSAGHPDDVSKVLDGGMGAAADLLVEEEDADQGDMEDAGNEGSTGTGDASDGNTEHLNTALIPEHMRVQEADRSEVRSLDEAPILLGQTHAMLSRRKMKKLEEKDDGDPPDAPEKSTGVEQAASTDVASGETATNSSQKGSDGQTSTTTQTQTDKGPESGADEAGSEGTTENNKAPSESDEEARTNDAPAKEDEADPPDAPENSTEVKQTASTDVASGETATNSSQEGSDGPADNNEAEQTTTNGVRGDNAAEPATQTSTTTQTPADKGPESEAGEAGSEGTADNNKASSESDEEARTNDASTEDDEAALQKELDRETGADEPPAELKDGYIKMTVVSQVKKEFRDQAKTIFKNLETRSRQEPGTLLYKLREEPPLSGTFLVDEMYIDRDSHLDHIGRAVNDPQKTEEMAAFGTFKFGPDMPFEKFDVTKEVYMEESGGWVGDSTKVNAWLKWDAQEQECDLNQCTGGKWESQVFGETQATEDETEKQNGALPEDTPEEEDTGNAQVPAESGIGRTEGTAESQGNVTNEGVVKMPIAVKVVMHDDGEQRKGLRVPLDVMTRSRNLMGFDPKEAPADSRLLLLRAHHHKMLGEEYWKGIANSPDSDDKAKRYARMALENLHSSGHKKKATELDTSKSATTRSKTAQDVENGKEKYTAPLSFHVVVRSFIPGASTSAGQGYNREDGVSLIARSSDFSKQYTLPTEAETTTTKTTTTTATGIQQTQTTTITRHKSYMGYVLGMWENDEVVNTNHRDFSNTIEANVESKSFVHVKFHKLAKPVMGNHWKRIVSTGSSPSKHFCDTSTELPQDRQQGVCCFAQDMWAIGEGCQVESMTAEHIRFAVSVQRGDPCVPGSWFAQPISHSLHFHVDIASGKLTYKGDKSLFPALEVCWGEDPFDLSCDNYGLKSANEFGASYYDNLKPNVRIEAGGGQL